MKQFLMELPVGLIAHGKIQPGLFVHNALGVGESEKTGFSVVGSHAAFTETAKSHFAGGQMDDGIVDAASAKATVSGDIAGCFFIPGEEIESQRMRHGMDVCHSFFQRIPGQHRQDGAEDFLLHDRIGEGYVVHDRRCNFQLFRQGGAAPDGLGGIHEFQDSLKMLFVDDFSISGYGEGIPGKLPADLFFDLLNELVLDAGSQ